jgi:hypothetical protein
LGAFAKFVDSSRFDFESPTRRAAEDVVTHTDENNAGPRARALAERTVQLARESDRQLLWHHRQYVITRLRQIAYEREYGEWRTYHDVIVPNRGDIRLAVSLLQQRQQ